MWVWVGRWVGWWWGERGWIVDSSLAIAAAVLRTEVGLVSVQNPQDLSQKLAYLHPSCACVVGDGKA